METEYDFGIIYFGLTRSTKKVYETHINNVFNVLKRNNLKYKTFLHTWKTNNNKQFIWEKIINEDIDYEEYKLLNPDFYRRDNQDDFLNSIDMNNYFYKDIWNRIGDNPKNGEWWYELIRNHLCALESKKRGLEMLEEEMSKGNKFKFIMFIRPDVRIFNELPLESILNNDDKISIPNYEHHEGYNDKFAIANYSNAILYGKRINEIIEFRKNYGRIVSEKYVKFIIDKYRIPLNLINFNFTIVRPYE
jgi:hypothetical protein